MWNPWTQNPKEATETPVAFESSVIADTLKSKYSELGVKQKQTRMIKI